MASSYPQHGEEYKGHIFMSDRGETIPEARLASGYMRCSRCGKVINLRYFHGVEECEGDLPEEVKDNREFAFRVYQIARDHIPEMIAKLRARAQLIKERHPILFQKMNEGLFRSVELGLVEKRGNMLEKVCEMYASIIGEDRVDQIVEEAWA